MTHPTPTPATPDRRDIPDGVRPARVRQRMPKRAVPATVALAGFVEHVLHADRVGLRLELSVPVGEESAFCRYQPRGEAEWETFSIPVTELEEFALAFGEVLALARHHGVLQAQASGRLQSATA